MTIYESMKQNIIHRRKAAKIRILPLCKLAGIHPSTYHNGVSGRVVWDMSTIDKMDKALKAVGA